MKKITLTLFLIVFALNIGQAQKKLSDVIGIQSTSNKTTTSQVVTDEMLGKKSSQIAREAELRATSQIDIEDLLVRYSNLGNQTGSVGDFFTAAEINQLKKIGRAHV